MAMGEVDEIYVRYIKRLSLAQRLQLLQRLSQDLKRQVEEQMAAPLPSRNIMELHGLGKESWGEVDAQQYVNDLRKEWDHRP
jgi:hypothetical protein